ncbi:hypothetical protein AAKU67_001394 [Oxalobacteraceae bacterium GrIS 2.11]
MNLYALRILVTTEAHLRLRRLSTLVTVFVVAAIGFWMFADQDSGYAFIAVKNAAVVNTSSTLALGSVSLFALVFGLAGFFLTRGRIAEDVRCGTGAVIGSSPISSVLFLTCRWLGGVAYLMVMATVFMLSVMVCHLLRGAGPIQLWVYLETYLIILFPLICFSVSCAVLFDSIPSLMGKLGDVVFFFLWVLQLASLAAFETVTGSLSGLLLFDFSGVTMVIQSLHAQLGSNDISLGYANFDTSLPRLTLGNDLWSFPMILMRCASAGLASLVVVPAFLFFHRYSSDKIKVSQTNYRRTPIALLNQLLRPLTQLVQPLFHLAANLPGMVGAALADVALTLIASPSAILALLAVWSCAIFLRIDLLPGVLLIATVFWGISVGDVATRDFANGSEDMTGAVGCGVVQRYLRQFSATVFLGLLFSGLPMLRLAFHHPFQAWSTLTGLLSLSALASVFGRTARTPRLFLCLFLFWVYVATQVPKSAIVDILGFNGAADVNSTLIQISIAIVALLFGYCYNRWAR